MGTDKKDVIGLTIHGQSCLASLEYTSSKKLVCQTPNAFGQGSIIVTTLSGGEGTCTVSFCGLEPEPSPLLDPLEESEEWMEEDLAALTIHGHSKKPQSPVYTRKMIDPLGLSWDEGRGGKRKPSNDNLGEMFPHGSGNLLAQNFNPAWFLLEKHRTTSFQDLKSGLRRLEMEVEKSDQAPIKFITDNLEAFLQCYDTLSDVNELLIRNESESQGGTLTDRIEELLRASTRNAESLFEGVLKCKSRADATRNALTVLQRYRFLFNLPKSIEKNIRNGEYDIVTNDYERAKSLFAGTQVKVFKKVLEEVENQIHKFRDDLHKKLHVLPSSLEEQKKTIKYLLELDCEGDPAWDCITNTHQWLLRLLFNCKEEFQAPGRRLYSPGEHTPLPPTLDSTDGQGFSSAYHSRGHTRTVSEVSFASSAGSLSSQATPASRGQQGSAIKIMCARDTGRPNRILFVEELTALISESLPDFWKLGQAYFSGSLFQGVLFSGEHQQQMLESCGNNKNRFEVMVQEIVEVFTDMVNCSLFPDAHGSLSKSRKERLGEWVSFDDSLHESSGAWLPLIVRQIRECVGSLQNLVLPDKAVGLAQQLAFNVRTLCADTLFYRATRDIEVLHEREDWRVHAEEGGIVTSLPILFENVVVEVLLTLKEIVIESDPGESKENHEELLKNSVEHYRALLEHFVCCLDYLAFQQEDDLHEESLTLMSRGSTSGSHATEDLSPPSDERLLMILSNLSYVMSQVIPQLFDCFVSHGYPQCPEILEMTMEQLRELGERVFQEYISRKSESLVGLVEPGMQVGFFDWEQCSEPEEVRSYIKDILLTLMVVHAEVYAVSSLVVRRVLSRLVELLSVEMLRLLREVEAFSYNGILYAIIELTVLQETLSFYLNDVSRKNFQRCIELLGETNMEANMRVRELMMEFKKRTGLQLRCFRIQRDTT